MPDALEVAIDAAQAAGELLRERFRLLGSARRLKTDRTLLTDADLEADELIAARITAAFPREAILSEEAQTEMPHDGRPTWVVDPIDGTSNFANGLHVWGVSIARLVGGVSTEAALYFPLLDELYSARRGAGARLNDSPLHTRRPAPDAGHLFFACCSRTHRRYDVSLPYKPRILGSAAYDFCAVSRGAAAAGLQATPRLWDLAAGWLVLEEAGGGVAMLAGPAPFPARPGEDYAARPYPCLMTALPEMLDAARAGVQPRNRPIDQ